MTALAIDLLREVSEAGGTVRLEGDMLRLSAPEPLPDELRARLRQHKAEIVALLSAAEPANDARAEVPPQTTRSPGPAAPRWPTASAPSSRLTERRACRRTAGRRSSAMLHQLVERRLAAQQALDLGWTTADLFGCDQRAPWHRLDRSGLVLLIGGHEIVELSSDVATLRTSTGSVLRHRRRPPAKPPVALLWEVLTSRAHPTGWPRLRPPAHRSAVRQLIRAKSGWRRRTWQDPAAILTTITHEGTIMAVSTLRALRGDASAISMVGLDRGAAERRR